MSNRLSVGAPYLHNPVALPQIPALTSPTKIGAAACSTDDRVGAIEKGKLANLLVVKEYPSSNVDILLNKENLEYIIKEGNLV